MPWFLTSLLACGLQAGALRAEVELAYGLEGRTAAEPGAHIQSLHIKDGFLVIETPGSGQYLLFSQKGGRIWVVNQKAKAYTTIDPRIALRVAERLQQSEGARVVELEKKIAELSAAERGQYQAMLDEIRAAQQRQREAAKGGKTAYKEAGVGQAGKWSADRVESWEGDLLSAVYSLAPIAELGVSPEDFEVLRAFQAFLGEVQASLPEDMRNIFADFALLASEGPRGARVPVRVVFQESERRGQVQALLETFPKTRQPKLFTVPPDYTERQLLGDAPTP